MHFIWPHDLCRLPCKVSVRHQILEQAYWQTQSDRHKFSLALFLSHTHKQTKEHYKTSTWTSYQLLAYLSLPFSTHQLVVRTRRVWVSSCSRTGKWTSSVLWSNIYSCSTDSAQHLRDHLDNVELSQLMLTYHATVTTRISSGPKTPWQAPSNKPVDVCVCGGGGVSKSMGIKS